MIELKNIRKVYNPKKRNRFVALRNISLTVSDGEFVAVTGESGSGKSTLLHIMGLLDFPTEGEYILNGKRIDEEGDLSLAKLRAKEIGFVKQDFALIENYSVMDNVTIPLYAVNSKSKRKDKESMAVRALERLGIVRLKNKQVSELSGGEKQRVAIARAMITNPKILLADEPTGSLDSKTGEEIFGIIEELNASGITVVVVTHDIKLAQRCGRILTIKDGELINA